MNVLDLGLLFGMFLLYSALVDVSATQLLHRTLSLEGSWEEAGRYRGYELHHSPLARRLLGISTSEFMAGKSLFFPFVELAGAAVLTMVASLHGVASLQMLASAVLLTLLFMCALIDRHMGIYPDELTYPMIALGLVFAFARWFLGDTEGMLDCLAGGAAAFSLIAMLIWPYEWLRGRRGMGVGDLTLCTGVGLFLGTTGFITFVPLFGMFGMALAVFWMLRGERMLEQDEEDEWIGNYKTPTGPAYLCSLIIVLLVPDLWPRWLALSESVWVPHAAATATPLGRWLHPLLDHAVGQGAGLAP